MKTLISGFALAGALLAQTATTTTTNTNQTRQVVELDRTPLYKVTVVQRTAKAINYRHRSGATKIDFRGTALMPSANGEAKVESKQGYIEIEVEFDDISGPATQFGPEYQTYVMWAITPEGRASNLGEVILNDDRSKLNVSTELQAFGLIVTAEPYFSVTQPSDVVVMENVVRRDTVGKVEEIDASYELLQRGQYTFNVDRAQVQAIDQRLPLDLRQARNAIQISRWAGADKYATDTFNKAADLLRRAEDYHARKQSKPAAMTAREAVQTAEDARLITVRRIDAERQEMERRAAAEREAAAKAQAEQQRQAAETARLKAEEEARQRQLAEERRQLEAERAQLARQAADQAKAEAEAAAQRLAQQKAEAEATITRARQEREAAEAARQAALQQQQQAQQEAERARMAATQAEQARLAAEQDKERMRQQLLQQLNMILETRDTARGLIVNMSDVLFDTGKWTLRPGAREKLARVAGIVLAYPGLRLEIEGHTDAVGSDDFNQRLSERRAASVREYLVSNGVAADAVTAKGFGETTPVASNDTAAGRQQNRRVELVVSGEVIGTKVSELRSVR